MKRLFDKNTQFRNINNVLSGSVAKFTHLLRAFFSVTSDKKFVKVHYLSDTWKFKHFVATEFHKSVIEAGKLKFDHWNMISSRGLTILNVVNPLNILNFKMLRVLLLIDSKEKWHASRREDRNLSNKTWKIKIP